MSDPSSEKPTNSTPVAVAETINDESVVLNKGAVDGVKIGMRFLIFGFGKEITDPTSGESLGRLELVRGTGRVIHIQDKIAVIESDMKAPDMKRIRKTSPNIITASSLFGGTPEIEEILPPITVPFQGVQRGDHARRI